ncbi:hTAFII28-like protein conserved region-domain-containing protein [Chaetomidium leptoderma]|uniref:HTAFII28-like protein conserved region-domain-containing protein n=1 Tax=Chaetomidium leptoderma TaxID=669021 RepID=A0AAN6VLX2_9PEZI|nr:hTAFII28-like protein conserved region-domain-containing protein [Chaetomidium leptoderma]
MASPSTHSPPYSSHTQLPGANTMSTNKKRTAEGAAAPALKRRKASAISTSSGPASAHPLRQTSFPPDDAGTLYGVRSPSVDVDAMSLVSGSQVSAAAPIKKKRGRKSKAEKAREQTPSVVGGRAATAISGASDGGGGRGTKSAAGGAGGGGDEGEGDDEGPTEVAATADVRTKEQKEEEHRMRGMLISALSEDQFYRFENWRAANLSKASVRRLVNATISQSVAENVVIGMRAVAKVFIGDIIESARRVQGEWIETTGEKQTDLPTPPAPPKAAAAPIVDGEGDTQGKDAEADDRRGPLRPEHLREAVRRCRKGFEGGGVGMQWVYHQQQQGGVERFPTRTGGRRIFR